MNAMDYASFIPSSKSRNNLFMNFLGSNMSNNNNNSNKNNNMLKSSSKYQITSFPDDTYNEKYWASIIPSAAYFHVYNSVLGDVFAMVYNNNLHNEKEQTLSTFIIAKHGCSVHPKIDISKNSKYYPAIENLSSDLKSSKVRKALAISLLKTFSDLNENMINSLYKQANLSEKIFDWDETQAGLLASQMTLIDTRIPTNVGSYLYELGYLTSNMSTGSYAVDVVYSEQNDNELLSEQNNALAFLIGQQLEQLFDPLTEYSPEPTEKVYKPPIDNSTKLNDTELIRSICEELISVQTNYTVSLVQFLQNFVVPLRVQVLENKLTGITTAKLNQIFPPTIDEVTRINCIFLDMLKSAQPFGSYEILKACGTTIPYFYKAQMRHEAAIKNFHANYLEFEKLMKASNRNDLLSFDQRAVETAVYSSLNLVKIQLIIQRLVKNQSWPSKLADNVKIFANSCDETISSFANDKLLPYNGRIFTPTGKILAEIAKGWPSQLQYGWLTRRVVAVFDATDVLTNSIKNRSVIIVFSDHVLFLSIDDDEYYEDYWKVENSIHKPSISDVLIHSLTNETPLTKLPHMTVKSWSNINDLHALYFTSNMKNEFELLDISNPTSYVRFFNEKDSQFTGIYELDKVSGKYVTEVLARSKILNKSQSFHLFCASIVNDDLDDNQNSENSNKAIKRIYYTAHEASTYEKEDTKSPFIVLFNQEYDENLLYKYNVYAFITLNFIAEDTVRLEALSRCEFYENTNREKLSYDIKIDLLSSSLSLILSELFTTHLSLYNPMMLDYLLENNGQVNSSAYKVLETPFEKLNSDKSQIINSIIKYKNERAIVNDVVKDKINRRKSLELLSNELKSLTNSQARKSKKLPQKPIMQNELKEKKQIRKPKQAKEIKKTSGGFFSFFNLGKTTKPSKPKQSKSIKSNKPKIIAVAETPERKSSVIIRRVISKKKNFDYSDLKPAQPKPKKIPKKRSSHAFAMFSGGSENGIPIVDQLKSTSNKKIIKDDKNKESNNKDGDNTTVSTSIYVNSNFEFPMEPRVIERENPITTASPRYGALKTEPNHKKGYKDSVNLMGKLEVKLPEDNHIYDEDLFELNSPRQKPISFVSNETNASTNSISEFEVPNNSSKVPTKIPSTERVWENGISPNNFTNLPDVLISNNDSNSFTKLQRSQSFYARFKHMRERQEKLLKDHGISYIKDISTLTTSDRNSLSDGFLFPSIRSGLNKKLDDEGENWTKTLEAEAEPELDVVIDSKESTPSYNLETSLVDKSKKIIVESLNQRIVSVITNHSIGSSVYVSDAELERLASIRSTRNAFNPYAPAILNEEIQMYNDDIDLLGDLELDKIDLKMDIFDHINYDLINEISAKSLTSSKPNGDIVIDKAEVCELTLGNLTIGDLNDSFFNTTSILSEGELTRSDTIRALSSLMKDKSYAYLNAILNGIYENDDMTIKKANSIKRLNSVKKLNLERDITDYDLAYYENLMNSSVNYLSDYVANDNVF